MTTISGATCFTQQVLAVWSDGKTTTAVRPPPPPPPPPSVPVRAGAGVFVANGGAGGSTEPAGLLPFQYQIPINRYNTLHGIAVRRSTSATGLAQQQKFPNAEEHRTRVFTTAIRTDLDEMSDCRLVGQNRNRGCVDCGNCGVVEHLHQLRKQLDLLESSKDASTAIRILREQMDEMEKNTRSHLSDRHHHHHHHQHQQQQQPSSSSSSRDPSGETRTTEEKGVQADWTLLMETETELLGGSRPQQRLSVPDLTKRRQRIGSKSHSVDDDDDEAGAMGKSHQVDEAMAEELKTANERLLSAKLREANLLAHLKDYRSRSEDLRRLISLREAHIGRLDEEIGRLKDALVQGKGKEKEMQSFISDLQLTLNDLHTKYDEYVVLGQLRDSEHAQVIVDLEKQISKLREEKHALAFGAPVLLGSQMQQLSKSAVHFQSTGCLGPGASSSSTASQNSQDKYGRGHRSVESSPATRRCVRYKDVAVNESPDLDDEILFVSSSSSQRVPVSSSSPSSSSSSISTAKRHSMGTGGVGAGVGPGRASQSPPVTARRSILVQPSDHHHHHRRASDVAVSSMIRPSASFNGRAAILTEEEEGERATGSVPARPSIPRGEAAAGESSSQAARTRCLVRKASYICGIQEHSMLDDLTDSVD